ncbi:MAG: hypothetical protein A3F13_07310 [Gammaproteobacteria bacterium RIFCSPHIGHO2_12_FULL_40_19]|nr:MAG: hypothetical protein A3F13_07310 [Gammaproteobacteria bacterium RIFCSPHIGHO2_12_FULL_40_19]
MTNSANPPIGNQEARYSFLMKVSRNQLDFPILQALMKDGKHPLNEVQVMAETIDLNRTQLSILQRGYRYGLRRDDFFSEEYKKMERLIIQEMSYHADGVFFTLVLDTLCALLSDPREPLTAKQAFSLMAKCKYDELCHLKETYRDGFRKKELGMRPAQQKTLLALLSDPKNPLTYAQARQEVEGLSDEACRLLSRIYPHHGRREHAQHFAAQQPKNYLPRTDLDQFPASYLKAHKQRIEKFEALIGAGMEPDRAVRIADEKVKIPSPAALFALRNPLVPELKTPADSADKKPSTPYCSFS